MMTLTAPAAGCKRQRPPVTRYLRAVRNFYIAADVVLVRQGGWLGRERATCCAAGSQSRREGAGGAATENLRGQPVRRVVPGDRAARRHVAHPGRRPGQEGSGGTEGVGRARTWTRATGPP